jgi:hypothetical protein
MEEIAGSATVLVSEFWADDDDNIDKDSTVLVIGFSIEVVKLVTCSRVLDSVLDAAVGAADEVETDSKPDNEVSLDETISVVELMGSIVAAVDSIEVVESSRDVAVIAPDVVVEAAVHDAADVESIHELEVVDSSVAAVENIVDEMVAASSLVTEKVSSVVAVET